MYRNTKETGDLGELIACGYLEKNGYKIIDRNIHTPFGELDILAKSPEKTYVFVEVKSAALNNESGNDFRQSYPQYISDSSAALHSPVAHVPEGLFLPEMHLNPKKLHKLRRLCQWYMNRSSLDIPYRIDGVCVDLYEESALSIRHYKNIGYQ